MSNVRPENMERITTPELAEAFIEKVKTSIRFVVDLLQTNKLI